MILTSLGESVPLLVDTASHEVVSDIEGLERQEAEASYEKYGNLHPKLYERLDTLKDGEKVPVAIWLHHDQDEMRMRIWEELAQRHPEIGEVIRQSGHVLASEDPELRQQLQDEYEELLAAELDRLVTPLLDALKAEGIEMQSFDMLPSASGILSKDEILLLSRREGIQTIFLIEGEGEPALNSAPATDRAPTLWASGFTGAGRRAAIVEEDNVPTTYDWLNVLAAPYRNGIGAGLHADLVAAAAASTHGTYPGVSKGATILNAGMTAATMPALYDSVNWALDNGADVINISYGGKLIYRQ
jgi:hypothetical protein